MKPTHLLLCALGLSSINLFASPLNNTQVSVPQFDGGINIGVTGAYLQPSFTNGYADYVSSNTGTSTNFASSLKNIDPGYDFAWGANLGYIFPHTGNDINVQYFRFHTDDSSSITGAFNTITLPYLVIIPVSGFPEFTTAFSNAVGHLDLDLDQIDVTAGQYINVGCRTMLHLSTGLRLLDLDNKINNTYTGFVVDTGTVPTTLNPLTLNSIQKSDFQGLGPMVNINGRFEMGYGFGLVGQITSAVLIGSIKDNWSVFASTVSSGITFNSLLEAQKLGTTQRIVPNIDGKIGGGF